MQNFLGSMYTISTLLMQLDFKYILIAAFIYLIILISLSTCIRVTPYSRNQLFSIDFPYEGFTFLRDKSADDISVKNKKEADKENFENITITNDCIKVDGFKDLHCSPEHHPILLDKFNGDINIVKQQHGILSPTCRLKLSEEQTKLLSSRGGNKTDIGNSVKGSQM